MKVAEFLVYNIEFFLIMLFIAALVIDRIKDSFDKRSIS